MFQTLDKDIIFFVNHLSITFHELSMRRLVFSPGMHAQDAGKKTLPSFSMYVG